MVAQRRRAAILGVLPGLGARHAGGAPEIYNKMALAEVVSLMMMMMMPGQGLC